MTAPADGTALYRIRGEGAVLLYIGISDQFGTRWKQHAQQQPWWGEMRTLSVDEWHAAREDAEEAEKAAIKAEKPKYNKTHGTYPSAPRRKENAEPTTCYQRDIECLRHRREPLLYPFGCAGDSGIGYPCRLVPRPPLVGADRNS